jgi:hypothetical protein
LAPTIPPDLRFSNQWAYGGGKDLSGNAELAPGERPFGIPKQNREKWNTESDLNELDVEIGSSGFLFSVELN